MTRFIHPGDKLPANKKGEPIEGTRGGWRPGGGRPAGTTNKLTAVALLKAIEDRTGKTVAEHLADGYADAIHGGDSRLRLEYERLILSKTVADKVDITVGETEEQLATKQMAFQTAIGILTGQTAVVSDTAVIVDQSTGIQ
jgi:hypothetical protein